MMEAPLEVTVPPVGALPPNKKNEQGPPSLFLPFFREPFRLISETV